MWKGRCIIQEGLSRPDVNIERYGYDPEKSWLDMSQTPDCQRVCVNCSTRADQGSNTRAIPGTEEAVEKNKPQHPHRIKNSSSPSEALYHENQDPSETLQ